MTKEKKGNVLVIHGGGLVDASLYVLMRIAYNMVRIFNQVFIGEYSFESFYTPSFIREYNKSLIAEVKGKRGTYFGTCRGIDLRDPILFERAIKCLKERNITTIIVAGGDGSSRQVDETIEEFSKKGINIIFPVPQTIDGINGGRSIGINEATKESIRQIENIVSTSLKTRDKGAFGVVMVELQGRNRDDIMANVIKAFDVQGYIADFEITDLLIRVVPANIETDEEKLIEEIKKSSKKTLVLISEGASKKNPNLTINGLSEKISPNGVGRKIRSLVVGHPSQSNNMTDKEDIRIYEKWVDHACSIIEADPYGSYCIANINWEFFKEPISYYAELNPLNGQKAELPEELKELIVAYMAAK